MVYAEASVCKHIWFGNEANEENDNIFIGQYSGGASHKQYFVPLKSSLEPFHLDAKDSASVKTEEHPFKG